MIRLAHPLEGDWPFPALPPRVVLGGRPFRRAQYAWQAAGIVAQYREVVARDSMHLYVLPGGRYKIDHLDEHNPDMGAPLLHLLKDVLA